MPRALAVRGLGEPLTVQCPVAAARGEEEKIFF